MRSHVLALLAGVVELVAGSCAADNCLRALRATQTPGRLQAAQSFCASFTTAPVAATAIPSYASSACKGDISSRLSSACSCIAPSTASTSTTAAPTAPAVSACAVVSSSWAVQKSASPSATPTVAASIAYECLNSIPLGKAAAIELVDSIEPYLEWQSDAAYKADPPKDYFYPGYDMFAALAKVKANLQADKYANEFQFQEDLYMKVFGPGHDGHFVYYPDALTRVFEWRRQRALVSISEDGTSLPVIKLYEDIISSPGTASVVKLINGIDAATYVTDTINKATYNQDVDAAYNTMFYQKASVASAGSRGYFASGGRIRYIYQGANTTFTFANGTVLTLENKAAVKADMTGVTDGPSYYSKFCSPNGPPKANSAASEVAAADAGVVVPGYPEPVIITKDSVVSGYYLDGEGFEDVAVISLLAFESDSIAEFQAVSQDFFDEAVAAGKTKLVIDFQNNGGGYILQGYDFFRQLFPSIVQDGFSRWKESDSFLAASHIVSDRVAGLNPYTSNNADLIGDYESQFNWRYDLNLTDQPFTSFEDKFAPHVHKNTKYTNLMRWNLNDNLTTTNATYGMGIEITGYGLLANVPQPFKAENIVILYDGVCASTCTLAAEMLRIQGGVKSIAMGGRPIAGPIQGVGGVKGSQVLQYSSIASYASFYLQHAENDEQRAALSRFSSLAVNRSSSAAVNVRDQILRDHVDDGLPAQFVYEAADCRLYWTLPMVNDVTQIWKAAAHAAFNGGKCAAGGILPPTKREANPPGVVGTRTAHVQRRSELVKRIRAPVENEAWAAAFQQKAIP
ncbi:pyridine nucleotide-disulfide oxidoreductase family protein [Podospora appendiculata]|uniref:Pyridine nucleotide-disulfide oxidoreductase family protein n=1 Tax=Podospora appendiculata TaxID=314037 RepID=A0AAE0X8K2_9PEZI|nr:pyridine nucleotide-disulfide oxidoreductase family protein [Podospora appendiculata]